jgi:hypothetical protein
VSVTVVDNVAPTISAVTPGPPMNRATRRSSTARRPATAAPPRSTRRWLVRTPYR